MKSAAQPASHFIPDRFTREVVLHIAKNYMPQHGAGCPLLLGVHGPSGEGKTFQCEQLLARMGIRTFLISGGQLENPDAGAPAQLIRRTYLEAGSWIAVSTPTTDRVAVLLLNDVDTGLGEWGPLNQTTVNRQTTFGELMHIADYPEQVEGHSTARIPIILTGNDLTKLYQPLTRSGRMRSFEWKPSNEERAHIVSSIFADMPGTNCELLLRRFPSNPISFFADLRSRLADDAMWSSLKARELCEIIPFVRRNRFVIPQSDMDEVLRIAGDLDTSSQLKDHLRKEDVWR